MGVEILSTPKQGKRYLVKAGDRITRIAPIAGVTPALIIDANAFLVGRRESLEKLPTIYPGDVLQIPVNQVLERPKREKHRTIPFKDKKEFTLVIENYEVPVMNGRLTRTMNTLADTFEASIAWNRGGDIVLDEKTKIGSDPECRVYLGENLVLDGYIPDITQISGDRNLKKFVGFSRTIHLVDSMLRPPYSKQNISLEQRCRDLAFPFGIDVVVSDAAKEQIKGQFKRVSGKPDETCFNHLLKLARQRGAILTNDIFGNLLIDIAKKTGESIDLITESTGRQTQEFSFRINNRERFQTYRAIGQSPKSNTNSGIVKDDSIKYPRLITFQADDADTGDLQKSAQWRKNKTVAAAYECPISVAGWYDSTGNLWEPNTIITVESETMEIPDGKQLLIEKVEYIIDSGNESAVLHPVPLFVWSTEELKTESEIQEAIVS